MTTKRTTHRSTAGRKLYAVRKKGKFGDIQTYKRAHGRDLRTRSMDECGAKVGLLIDAARALRMSVRGEATKVLSRRAAIDLVCSASAVADLAIAKAVKARARKRA